jgi:CrcB protein
MDNLDEADTDSAESARLRSNYIDLLCALIGIVFYAGALLLYFLGPHAWRHSVTFALLLGPPGTMLRYALSKLNAKLRWQGRFPIGTFIANMLATAVLAGVYAGQRSPGKGGRTSSLTVTGCNALYALQQGFCGCLSTVSTFVVEVKSIQRTRWKWIYAGGSVLLGHLLILAIVGGVSWSGAGLGQTC